MTTELTATNAPTWTDEDKALIREMAAKNSTPSEFKVLLYQAQKYGLDPLLKEIYSQKYGDSPASIIVTIGGLLKSANRGGKLDGLNSECFYDNSGKLLGARAAAWKKGCQHPFTAEVDFSEYTTGKNLWLTKPKSMIRKVAMAHALRLGFPLSGLYIAEEMEAGGIDNEEMPRPVSAMQGNALPAPTKPASGKMGFKEFGVELGKLFPGVDARTAGQTIARPFGFESVNELMKSLEVNGVENRFAYILAEYPKRLELIQRADTVANDPFADMEELPDAE